jgi:pimeloyl-ACP methyl ester carboxylesterase
MSAATEIVFMPGFDGVASLRKPFLDALARRFPVRAITYPNRPLESLNGYARFAAGELGPESRPVLVAESFSGLVAARWAARDPHVAGIVLCAGFARNPMTWLTSLGAALPSAVQLGSHFLRPTVFAPDEPLRRQWSSDLARTLRTLDSAVIAERFKLIAEEDLSGELRGLRVPAVLLQFEGDLVIGPRARRELESALPEARVTRIDAPHFALETLPRECADAVAVNVGHLF